LKKTIVVLLTLGILVAGMGIVNAAETLNITANVQSALTLALDPGSLTYNDIQPGVASAAQTLTATTSGSGSYHLTLASTTFTSAAGTQSASVLQFKEQSAETYKNASSSAQNMLSAAGTATAEGDEKQFDLRVNFPVSAADGTYGATVTITAVPQ
jgi:hypothetical protein